MVGSCPEGYAAGTDWCVPMPGTTREAVESFGHYLSGWVPSGMYCLGPERPGKRPATTQGWKQLLATSDRRAGSLMETRTYDTWRAQAEAELQRMRW